MILVTGATGLVGGNLLWHLLQENERIFAIHRETSKLEPLRTIFSFYTSTPDDYLNRIDWRLADVLDESSIARALQGIDIVYHCAAVVSLGSNADVMSDTNVLGTRNIVKAALENNVQRFCFVSSIAACGKSIEKAEIDETSVWEDNPNRSLYSRSKFYSEQEVWKGIEKGLNGVIVNPGVILGISGTNTGSSQLFAQMKKGLLFYTNGGSGYVDVRDVVRAMIQLTNSSISGERFILVGENCSSGEILSWMADGFGKLRPKICIGKKFLIVVGFLLELLGKIFHFSPLIDRGTARSATHREHFSNEKVRKAIGFEFTPIEGAIKEYCRFLSRN